MISAAPAPNHLLPQTGHANDGVTSFSAVPTWAGC
jgi:hypothetical protein